VTQIGAGLVAGIELLDGGTGLVSLAMFVNSLSSSRDSQLNESRFLELCRKATPGYGL
jgi:hypothetical protein